MTGVQTCALPIFHGFFDHLFPSEKPMDVEAGVDWVATVNKDSREVVKGGYGEPCLAEAKSGDRFQFERLGYFACDPDTLPGRPVFNRSVSLRDSWAKIEKKGG